MEKWKLFRDRQEVGPDDFMGMQEGIRGSFDHIVADGLTKARQFVDLQVTKESATSIRVAAGRLYDGGKVHTVDLENVMNVSTHMPVVNRKLLAVYVWGTEADTDIQERNFVTDVSVYPPVGEPQAVPITKIRKVEIGVVSGVESVDPQMPAVPENACLVATVVLTPTGILDNGITRAIQNVLPSVAGHDRRLAELDVWKAQTGAKVDALTSEQAALNDRTVGKADAGVVVGMMSELSKLKRLLNLPTNGAPYDTDLFADSSKIDQDVTTEGTHYRIPKFGGIEFPYAGKADGTLGLFNPYESNVHRTGDDFILPKFEPVVAVEVSGYSGETNISQFSVTTTVTKLMQGTKTETRYGYA